MSGIFGIFNVNGTPVDRSQLEQMASLLVRRGRDRTSIWSAGRIGLGQTLLATTVEGMSEHLPLEHSASGCVITGDIRLDNRRELLAKLRLLERGGAMGDGEIVLESYLRWDHRCVDHLLGDFAFAVWDPRRHSLFCARDHLGMRQLIYHRQEGEAFIFATEPRAILALPRVPYQLNEERIADFLVDDLEAIDTTSTFFEHVLRLPPAHAMTITPESFRKWRYWRLTAAPELILPSDEEYADAFLEVFTEAVSCRLRTAGSAGSMLSGGLDSAAIVAVASDLLAGSGGGSLFTFSAVAPPDCVEPETRAIRASMTIANVEPTTVSYGDIGALVPVLKQLLWDMDEPFDGHMNLVRAVYLTARERGLRMLLDGVAGDLVLSHGDPMSRLLRARRWRTAYREARGEYRFWNGGPSPLRTLAASGRAAFVPDALLKALQPLRRRRHTVRAVRRSFVNPDFAKRIDLGDRYRAHWAAQRVAGFKPDGRAQRTEAIGSPILAIARERYDRVASAIGIEPRDPFCDVRLTSLCVTLPDDQTLSGGWPKVILRRAMAGRLPDDVRWRRGKEHLGWDFTNVVMESLWDDDAWRAVTSDVGLVSRYLDLREAGVQGRPGRGRDDVYHLWYLLAWLHQRGARQQPAG